MRRTPLSSLAAAGALALVGSALTVPAVAGPTPTDSLVSSGSPATPFPQNKQNEPAIARDPISGTLIAGSNDEIDLAKCGHTSSGTGTCPFTAGVGVSGVYFSSDGGVKWTQPTYGGWTARDSIAPSGGHVGPIGTLPNYFEAGLVADGDPGLAVGPQPDSHGRFAWSNGSRFYYSNLTSNFPGSTTIKSQEAVAVSHTDDPAAAAAGGVTGQSKWSAPTLASGKLNPVLFDDKCAIWVDNATSSPFFGRVYVSWTAFRAAVSHGRAEPEPIMVAHSDDGGDTWSSPTQVTPGANNSHNTGRQGSTIRTGSDGTAFLFWEGFSTQLKSSVQDMAISHDGGDSFSKEQPVAVVTDVGAFDALTGRFVFDGFAGARTDSFPSVDIANGAPSGAGTNRILLGWSDARDGLNHEKALLQTSNDGGATWTGPVAVQAAGDRPDFTAVAISPNGKDAYAVYDAFTVPFQSDLTLARTMQGVVVGGPGNLGSVFKVLHRGAPGDARGSSQNNLVLEFLGDYNQATASNGAVFAVWNDVRNAESCTAVNKYRSDVRGGTTPFSDILGEDSPDGADAPTSPGRPVIPLACASAPLFGNSDIYGGAFSRP